MDEERNVWTVEDRDIREYRYGYGHRYEYEHIDLGRYITAPVVFTLVIALLFASCV